MHLGGLIHQLVHCQRQEIAEHDVDNRSQTRHRRSHSHPREARFRDRRVHHSLSAEFLHQTRQHFERRSRFRDVFPKNAHARIAAHLFRERFADGLRKRQLPCGHFRHTRLPRLAPLSDTVP